MEAALLPIVRSRREDHKELGVKEPMQIVRYEKNEKYTCHFDNKGGSKRRVATFMVYLRANENLKEGLRTFQKRRPCSKKNTKKMFSSLVWKTPKNQWRGLRRVGLKYVRRLDLPCFFLQFETTHSKKTQTPYTRARLLKTAWNTYVRGGWLDTSRAPSPASTTTISFRRTKNKSEVSFKRCISFTLRGVPSF